MADVCAINARRNEPGAILQVDRRVLEGRRSLSPDEWRNLPNEVPRLRLWAVLVVFRRWCSSGVITILLLLVNDGSNVLRTFRSQNLATVLRGACHTREKPQGEQRQSTCAQLAGGRY